MTRTLIIGTGRMAYQLGHSIVAAGMDLVGVAGRNAAKVNDLSRFLERPAIDLHAPLPEVDLVLIVVSDDAIAEVAASLPTTDAVVAHTAGAKDLDVLAPHAHRGVIWPIQSLSHGAPVELRDVPLAVDGSDTRSLELLLSVSRNLSSSVVQLPPEQRRIVHLAAVLASNFPVLLLREAQALLRLHKLPPQLLMPLWRSTATKVAAIGPDQAMTGPARRGDHDTVQRHLDLLPDGTPLKRIYALLSDRILEVYGQDRTTAE